MSCLQLHPDISWHLDVDKASWKVLHHLCKLTEGLLLLRSPPLAYKTSPSGSNLGGNITNFKTSLLMWHVVNEERDACGNLASYYNITHIRAK